LEKLSPKNNNKVHFIGIGGIGTSALARWFLSCGYDVSGSDINLSEIISELKKQGVKVFIGHRPENLAKEIQLVIYSAAVPFNNPEFQKAKKLGIPIKSYAEALGDLSKKYKTFAVSGAHGKSTTTALLSLILIRNGFDPTVIIGTKLKEFNPPAGGSNFRKGKSNYLILEADEYNHSFLNYSPFAAIILNIDKEHLDSYKNLADIKKTFLKFINNIQPNGILIVNKDDKNLFSLKDKIQKIVKNKNIELLWYGITNSSDRQNLLYLRKTLKISGESGNVNRDALLGEHNVSNALAAYTLAKALKIKDRNIFSAIGSYRGAWRRMEYKGEFKIQSSKFKVKVYDDYAHHPTEIKATLAGIAQKSPKTGIICVFQPHQVKRLKALFKEFVGAFDAANALILLPIYQVAGRDPSTSLRASKVSQNVNSKQLAEAIKNRVVKLKTQDSRLKTVVCLPHPEKLPSILEKIIHVSCFKFHASCIVVMMGAGDIYKMTDKLIR